MGFFNNLWSGIKKGASKVGDFVANKVRPVVGKINAGVKKVSHFINTDKDLNSFLDAISFIPIPGLSGAIDGGRKLSKVVEQGADLVDRGLNFGDNVASAIQHKDLGHAGKLVHIGRDLYNDVNQFNRPVQHQPNIVWS